MVQWFCMQLLRITGVLVLSLMLLHCGKEPAPAGQATGTVTLRIGEKDLETTVTEGQTLLSVMESLKQEGRLELELKGAGEMSMVASLDGRQSEGPGETKRNWLFARNGKLSAQGIGQLQLMPGDEITWCFIRWEDRQNCR